MNLETISNFLASKSGGSFLTGGMYFLLAIAMLGSLLHYKIGCLLSDLSTKIQIQNANREDPVQSYQTQRRYRRYLKLTDLVINACLMGIALGLLLLVCLHA